MFFAQFVLCLLSAHGQLREKNSFSRTFPLQAQMHNAHDEINKVAMPSQENKRKKIRIFTSFIACRTLVSLRGNSVLRPMSAAITYRRVCFITAGRILLEQRACARLFPI